jgi:hypothetical protein
MDEHKTTYIDMANVLEIARGDEMRRMRYLDQFVTLVNDRSAELKQGRGDMDRQKIRMVVHSMKPQLLFFGVDGVGGPIEKIESQSESLSESEMGDLVDFILSQCSKAVGEVNNIMEGKS